MFIKYFSILSPQNWIFQCAFTISVTNREEKPSICNPIIDFCQCLNELHADNNICVPFSIKNFHSHIVIFNWICHHFFFKSMPGDRRYKMSHTYTYRCHLFEHIWLFQSRIGEKKNHAFDLSLIIYRNGKVTSMCESFDQFFIVKLYGKELKHAPYACYIISKTFSNLLQWKTFSRWIEDSFVLFQRKWFRWISFRVINEMNAKNVLLNHWIIHGASSFHLFPFFIS